MKAAFHHCGCVPWNYPPYEFEPQTLTPVCDTYGNYCFDQFLIKQVGKSMSHCKCLPNCNEVSYSYSMKEEKLNIQDYCFICKALQGDNVILNKPPSRADFSIF